MFKNKKVAFIASGGGGRGVAHGGVLKACEDMGIKFDFLIGSSSGAIFVTYYSQLKSADAILDLFKPARKRQLGRAFGWRHMISFKNFFSKNIKSGIIDLSGAEEFFRKTLDINDFKKLDMPVYMSATNLNSGEGEIFGPGFNDHVPISQAIVASCCLPIIFRPVKIGSSYYIDGEVKRPTTVNNAFELGADVAIVSDTYTSKMKNIEKTSMFGIFGQMANMLFEDKSMRGVKIAKSRFPNKEIIVVNPDVGNMSSMHTFSYKKLENLGYNAAIKILQNYREKNG
jgi:NTE family protein